MAKLQINREAQRSQVMAEFEAKKAKEEALKKMRLRNVEEVEVKAVANDSGVKFQVKYVPVKSSKWATISDEDESGQMVRRA